MISMCLAYVIESNLHTWSAWFGFAIRYLLFACIDLQLFEHVVSYARQSVNQHIHLFYCWHIQTIVNTTHNTKFVRANTLIQSRLYDRDTENENKKSHIWNGNIHPNILLSWFAVTFLVLFFDDSSIKVDVPLWGNEIHYQR